MTKRSLAAALLLGLGLTAQGSLAAERIFDGESLAGWHVMTKPAGDAYRAGSDSFVVEDGAIVCTQGEGQQGGMLLTDATYIDFDLELELKSDWGCDSGIFIRCTDGGEGIQILNDYLPGGNVGGIYGQGTGGYFSRPIQLEERAGKLAARDAYDGVELDGLLYSIDAATWNKIWKADDWNTLHVRCLGVEPRITTWINGVKVMEMDGRVYQARRLEDVERGNWSAPTAWDRETVQSITGNAGSIGLEVRPGNRWKPAGEVRYRNIRLTPIK